MTVNMWQICALMLIFVHRNKKQNIQLLNILFIIKKVNLIKKTKTAGLISVHISADTLAQIALKTRF